MRLKLCHFICGLVLLTGCGKSSSPEPGPQPPVVPPTPPSEEKIPIKISTDIMTRATETAYVEGDQVGIYVVNVPGTLSTSGNHVDNMRFVYGANGWSPDIPIYWADQKTNADFYVYYPYNSSVGSVSSFPFSVQTDQTSETGYSSSEFLLGVSKNVAPTPEPIRITTKHCMSKLEVYLQAGTGWSEEDIDGAQITVCGLKTAAEIDFTEGSVTATGEESEIHPYKVTTGEYKALVVPQEVIGQDLVRIKIGENEYSLNTSVKLLSNKQHKCSIIVNRTSEGVNVGIGAWETDETDYGGTVE